MEAITPNAVSSLIVISLVAEWESGQRECKEMLLYYSDCVDLVGFSKWHVGQCLLDPGLAHPPSGILNNPQAW